MRLKNLRLDRTLHRPDLPVNNASAKFEENQLIINHANKALVLEVWMELIEREMEIYP